MQNRLFYRRSAMIPDRARLFVLLAATLFLLATGTISRVFAQGATVAEINSIDLQTVRSSGFVLEQAATISVGATCVDDRKTRPISTMAWILDANTRRPVWEFDPDDAKKRGKRLLELKQQVELPAGAYETYYASFLNWQHDWRGRRIGDIVRNVMDEIFDRDDWGSGDEWQEKYEEVRGDLGVNVRTSASARSVQNVNALAKDFLARAFVTATRVGDDSYLVEGFELNRTMDVDIYSIGEIIDDDRYDYAWIINTDSRRRVWEMDSRNTVHAGGADKNRMSRDRVRLPEGKYAVFYTSDGSHSATEWNAPPPYDPVFWGVTVLVRDRDDLRNVSRFEYENVPLANAIVQLRGMRDDEHRSAGFSVSRPTALRIYALGEGRDGRMFDYGWIIDSETRERVWMMEHRYTEHAGGAVKNRLFDDVVELDAGDYEAHYVTDDSHSYGDWNSDRPFDPAAWGMTIVPADPADANRLTPFDPTARASHLAQIVRVGDDEERYRDFTLEKDSRIRVYALGEGVDRTMYDYGWIENSDTGRVVWEMTYRMTEHAGGANKNRMTNTVVMLPKGNYRLYYRSDDSHSYDDWNASPPIDIEYWGITVSRAR